MSIKLTAASVAALLMAAPALAADMNGIGGNCCTDLEERVAELEATAARKGNRKVSLTVYGSVNYAIMHTEVDVPGDGDNFNETTITNNPNAQSRVGFKGDATISKDWSAGFLIEIGLGEADPALEAVPHGWHYHLEQASNGVLNDALVIRHSALYLKHSQLGAFWLGKTSSATDGIAEISIANTANASTLLSLEPMSSAWLGGINLPFDGGRTEVVKWVSPIVGGFSVSAAWMNNADEAWDVALRYAGELAGFKLAAGVGYRNETSPYSAVLTTFNVSDEVETISGSASVMHSASGLFVNAAAGKVDGVAGNGVLFVGPITGNEYAFPWIDPRAVHVQAGIEKNFFGFGNTTLFGEWANAESKLPVGNDKIDLEFWGLGVNQAIDGAAMDLYVSYRHYDLGLKGSPDDGGVDADALVGGAVIRF